MVLIEDALQPGPVDFGDGKPRCWSCHRRARRWAVSSSFLGHFATGLESVYGRVWVFRMSHEVSVNFAPAFPYTARWPPLVVEQSVTDVLLWQLA